MIILASASPRRRELLSAMGIGKFDIRPSCHESPLRTDMDEAGAVELIALGKARDISSKADKGDTVIAADTLVFLDGKALGKPKSEAEAKNMLSALSGREHRVITGLAVIADGREYTDAVTTLVRFLPLTEEQIDWYVSTGEPMDKAGAYGIQGLGGMLIEGITGDYFNVVGLPVARLARLLEAAGHRVFSRGQMR